MSSESREGREAVASAAVEVEVSSDDAGDAQRAMNYAAITRDLSRAHNYGNHQALHAWNMHTGTLEAEAPRIADHGTRVSHSLTA